MILVCDIGNTNIVIGAFKEDQLKDSLRISTRTMTVDEAGLLISGWLSQFGVAATEIDSVVVGSVVPNMTSLFEELSKKYFGCFPLVVSARTDLSIRIAIDQPDQLGADRIANSVAAYSKYGGPAIVVDFGTSTNFDIIDKDGVFIGGVLSPGPQTSMAELSRRAARLFDIRIEHPESVIGKSTSAALKSGLFYGTIGQVDYILECIIAEAKFDKPTIVATGGFAIQVQEHSRYIKLVEPNLTLEGLRLIGEGA